MTRDHRRESAAVRAAAARLRHRGQEERAAVLDHKARLLARAADAEAFAERIEVRLADERRSGDAGRIARLEDAVRHARQEADDAAARADAIGAGPEPGSPPAIAERHEPALGDVAVHA